MSRRPPPEDAAEPRGPYPLEQPPYEQHPLYPYPYTLDEGPYEEQRVRLLSPLRLLLGLLVLGSSAAVSYALFISPQLPLAVSSLAVLGVTLGLFALSIAGAAAGLGRQGDGGRAVLLALVGGLCAFAAAGSLAGAIILGILAAGA